MSTGTLQLHLRFLWRVKPHLNRPCLLDYFATNFQQNLQQQVLCWKFFRSKSFTGKQPLVSRCMRRPASRHKPQNTNALLQWPNMGLSGSKRGRYNAFIAFLVELCSTTLLLRVCLSMTASIHLIPLSNSDFFLGLKPLSSYHLLVRRCNSAGRCESCERGGWVGGGGCSTQLNIDWTQEAEPPHASTRVFCDGLRAVRTSPSSSQCSGGTRRCLLCDVLFPSYPMP